MDVEQPRLELDPVLHRGEARAVLDGVVHREVLLERDLALHGVIPRFAFGVDKAKPHAQILVNEKVAFAND